VINLREQGINFCLRESRFQLPNCDHNQKMLPSFLHSEQYRWVLKYYDDDHFLSSHNFFLMISIVDRSVDPKSKLYRYFMLEQQGPLEVCPTSSRPCCLLVLLLMIDLYP
jgi:hypothetical protein